MLREKWRGDLDIAGRAGYILTTADTLVPPESQRAMAASIGARVSEIHTDHGPFREQPERLAELLVGVVADRQWRAAERRRSRRGCGRGLPGLGWLARHHGHAAMAITHDERVHMTPGFNAWLRTKADAGIH